MHVRILSHEFKSEKGIIMPGLALPGMSGGGEGNKEAGVPTIKLIEIVAVGEGKLNNVTGEFMGSRYKPGQKCLLRHGISAIAHIDYIPGTHNEAIVQEDTIVAILDEEPEEVAT